MMKKAKEIRDPLHGIISLDDSEVQILDHPFLQRLRFIKQLDFMDFIFPGATHTRFLHSLGSFHLASLTFDQIFKKFFFRSQEKKKRLRTSFKLAALLHDLGHGPLSHATEWAMPIVSSLWENTPTSFKKENLPMDFFSKRKAQHEDYTIKMILDSPLTESLKISFPDIDPFCIAGIIDGRLKCAKDFFLEGDINFRPILNQLISSDIDVDRMDYIGRDAYFCGLNFRGMEWSWLISNMTYYEKEGSLYLALYRKALPAFEQFLLIRHYMRLMVYFHQKSIIYKEILRRYFSSADCSFKLPSKIQDYVKCTDATLNEHLKLEAAKKNNWAKQIVTQTPHKLLFEDYLEKPFSFSDSEESFQTENKKRSQGSFIDLLYRELIKKRFQVILSEPSLHFDMSSFSSNVLSLQQQDSSSVLVSPQSKSAFLPPLFLINPYDPSKKPQTIESDKSLKFFKSYERIHHMKRLYVIPSELHASQSLKEKIFQKILSSK